MHFTDAHALKVARRRGILSADETFPAGVARVVSALAEADARLSAPDSGFAEAATAALLDGRLALSSQLFAAAGRDRQAAACTVLPRPSGPDGEALRALIADATAASGAGMGCGIDVSSFADPAATARAINDAMLPVHRALVAADRRPPALMITCDAAHPAADAFVDVKGGADFAAWVANISVRFDDDPGTYARLREQVAAGAHRNGEPGMLFGAPADADNPTPDFRLESTAPCAEVFMAAGERCVFVTVNLAAHVRDGSFDFEELDRSIALAVRIADNAVELAVEGAPPVVAARRRVGVGVCGFHTALIRLGTPYAASEPLAGALGERLTHRAHQASADLAATRGPFPAWATSRWREPAWLRRKAGLRRGAVPKGEWTALEEQVLRTGVRNAVIVAFPPTGIVSELLGVSKSYEPHFSLRAPDGTVWAEVEDAVIGADGQIPDAGEDHVLACARQLTPATHLAVHAAFCAFADEAGSKTVNLASDATVDDVLALYDEARDRGLKGLTVFRDGCLDEVRA